ncbi:hypothetical protein LINGRAHAP2_LOCUS3900 [Linum grandiflorum]
MPPFQPALSHCEPRCHGPIQALKPSPSYPGC